MEGDMSEWTPFTIITKTSCLFWFFIRVSDEALAQWLQDEEEVDRTLEGIALATPQTTKFSPYSWQQYAPVSGSHVSVRSQQAPHHFRPGSKPINLQDIMDEEMDKQRKHERQVREICFVADCGHWVVFLLLLFCVCVCVCSWGVREGVPINMALLASYHM